LSLQNRFGHLGAGRRRGIESRTGLEQVDNFAAALAGALDDRVQPVGGQVIAQRNPAMFEWRVSGTISSPWPPST
jgi:hypothetical protein